MSHDLLFLQPQRFHLINHNVKDQLRINNYSYNRILLATICTLFAFRDKFPENSQKHLNEHVHCGYRTKKLQDPETFKCVFSYATKLI